MIDYKKNDLFIQRAVFAALLIVVGATAFKQPAWILNYTSVSFIFGLVFILLAILPCGQQVLGDKDKALPFKQYFKLLFAGLSALLILSMTVGFAFVGVGPKSIEGLLAIQDTQFLIKQHYLMSWGLFPWALFGMWGLMIAYIGYVKKEYPLVGNIARLLFSNIFEIAIKNFSEYIIFIVSLFCFLFSLVGAILLLSYSFDIVLGLHSHLFVHFTTLVILSLIPSVFFFIGRNTQFLRLTKNLNLAQALCIFTGIMILVLVFCAFLGERSFAYFLDKNIALQANCAQYFEHISMETKILSLLWGWFLLWVPLAGSFIARISYGRTVKEVVMGVLLVPTLFLAMYMILINVFNVSDLLYYLNYSSYFKCIIYLMFSIFTLGIIFWMIHNAKNNVFFYSGFMPLPSLPKRSRIDLRWAPKLWGLKKLFKSLAIGVVFIILAHTLGGWFVMSFQFLALGVFMMLILLIGSIGFIYHLIKEKALIIF